MIYVYKINNEFTVGIIADNTTMARHGIDQRFQGASVSYVCGPLTEIIQVNGNATVDGEFKIVEEKEVKNVD